MSDKYKAIPGTLEPRLDAIPSNIFHRPATNKVHTAYAVVYKRNSSHMDGEMKKGDIHSIHMHLSAARLAQNSKWHVVKKITFNI